MPNSKIKTKSLEILYNHVLSSKEAKTVNYSLKRFLIFLFTDLIGIVSNIILYVNSILILAVVFYFVQLAPYLNVLGIFVTMFVYSILFYIIY